MSASLSPTSSFDSLMDKAVAVVFGSAIVNIKGQTAPIEGILEGLNRSVGIELRVGDTMRTFRWGEIESISPGKPSNAAKADKP